MDLSKELGEIKRVWCNGTPDTFSPLDGAGSEDAVMTIQRLLSIIETEIPGMLRARVEELDKERRTAEFYTAKFGLAAGAQELSDMADAIESLTKKEEG